MLKLLIIFLLSLSYGLCGNPFKVLLPPGENQKQPFISFDENVLSSLGAENGILITASLNEGDNEKLPIYEKVTPDCSSGSCYELKRFAFNASSYPKWTNFSEKYFSPELHFIPSTNKTLLYFCGYGVTSRTYGFGSYDLESGDLTSKAIISDKNFNIVAASVLVDSQLTQTMEKKTVIYVYYVRDDSENVLYAKRLSNDGTASDSSSLEDAEINYRASGKPTILQRGRFYYLLYTVTSFIGQGRRYDNYGRYHLPSTALGGQWSYSPLEFNGERKNIIVYCPKNTVNSWGNCSIATKKTEFFIVCEVSAESKGEITWDQLPTRPGLAILGWTRDQWPYIHAYEKADQENGC